MRENSARWYAGDRSSAASTLGVAFSFVVSVWLLVSPFGSHGRAVVRARTVGHAQLVAALFAYGLRRCALGPWSSRSNTAESRSMMRGVSDVWML